MQLEKPGFYECDVQANTSSSILGRASKTKVGSDPRLLQIN